ncbi:MAG: sugar phosphate isomerase/epimerase [Gammaproteobacteria bacterium]|nr:sugar phosphate isomerase/epimerase [Gammaproteobacteria bacterium]MBL4728732.1 sugar phosphate isomerase/epimerase [Gammaproteobacteria bacterium]
MNIKTLSTARGFNRRNFLRSCALLTAATSLPLSALAQGRRVDNVGLQLYTLRNELSQDFEGTLAHVAELGYKEMEFAGYYGRSASEVRGILDQNGMTSPAAHIQLQALRDDLEGEVERAAILGQKYLVVPILPESQRNITEYHRTADYLNRAGEVCKQAGIKMGYHNHNFEFEEIDGQIPYDILLDETDADLVDMELDLYWIRYAGVDPIPYFKNHPGRFSMLHVKDMDEFGRIADVGSGEIDFAEIFSHVDTAGFKHFFVEHDRPGNGLASVAVSIYTVRNIVF